MTTPKELAALVNKAVGSDALRMGSHPSYQVTYTPTGLLPMDILFQGGIPSGRFVQIHGDYCVSPKSKVLTEDLRWTEAGKLEEGDDLIGFDEVLNQGRGRSSTLQRARVLRIERKHMPCYRVVTDHGETTVSANHRFVVRDGQRPRTWRAAEDLNIGDNMVWFGAPWDEDVSHGAGYLAGIFDGEGWLDQRRVCVGQLPGAVFNTIRHKLDDHGYPYVFSNQGSGVQSLRITGGLYESLRFLGEVRPVRLLNNAAKMWVGSSIVSKGPNATIGRTVAKVLDIEFLGDQEVVAFKTSTGTFISDGFYSHNSTLKSYVGLSAIAEYQRRGKTCAVIDTERTFDPLWATQTGVRTDDLILWPNREDDEIHTGEEAIDVTQALVKGGVDFVMFDSVAAALPQDEMKKRLHDENIQPGRLAMLMSAAMRRLTASNRGASILWINQTRVNLGITFGSNEAVPGGKALGFYSSYILSMRKAGKVTRDDKTFDGEKWQNGKTQIGQKFKAEITKSKLNRPFRDVFFTWDMTTGSIDLIAFLISQGEEIGAIAQKGNTWHSGGVKAVGREKFKQALTLNPDEQFDLENIIRDHHQIPLLTKPKTKASRSAGNPAPAAKKVLRRSAR